MKKNAALVSVLILFLAIVSGCPQKKGPTDPIPVNTPSVSVLSFSQLNVHLCRVAQTMGGSTLINGTTQNMVVLINSQANFDSYVASNNIYSGLTTIPAPPAVDYANKSLLGYVMPIVGREISFKYNSIITDGTTTTVNATLTTKYCPITTGPYYIETCGSFFTQTDKITTPMAFNVTRAFVDCDGNTMAPPVFIFPTPTAVAP